MDLERYMKLMAMSNHRAFNYEKNIKLSTYMKRKVNKFVVAAKPRHRKSWTFSSPFKYDPLKFGSAPRPHVF